MGSLVRARRSRASTTFSTEPALIRTIASATTPSHSGGVRTPSLNVTRPSPGPAADGAVAGEISLIGGSTPPTPIVVSHQSPPRWPTRTSGITSAPPDEEWGEKANEPKATGPVPGRRTSSRITEWATTCDQARSAAAKRSGPEVLTRIASPQATKPSLRRTQARAARAGKRSSSGPGSGSGTVRATRGRVAGAFGIGMVIAVQGKTPRICP